MASPEENASTGLPAGLPADWVFDADLPCPSCRYNLRMLRTPRCPECGVTFRWQALLRIACPRCGESLAAHDGPHCPRCALELNWPALLGAADVNRRADYFEYADHPIRATLRSFWAALRPAHFWQTVPLESPPAVSRLRKVRRSVLWILLAALLLPNLAGLTGQFAWHRPSSTAYGWVPINGAYYPRSGLTVALHYAQGFLPWIALAAVGPLTTLLALPLFVPTLARFRVQRAQLLRCTTLGLAGLLWSCLLLLIGALAAFAVNEAAAYVSAGTVENTIWYSVELLLACVFGGWPILAAVTQNQAVALLAFNAYTAAALLALAFLWQPWNLWICLTSYLRLSRGSAAALWLSVESIALLALLIIVLWALTGTNALNAILNRLGLL